MNKISALMLLFLSACSTANLGRYSTVSPNVPGLTLQEIEERHRLVYKDPSKKQPPCNGFAVDDLLVYTANHCVNNASAPVLEDGTSLEKLVSSKERDIAILSPESPAIGLREAPIYHGELTLGDQLMIIVYAPDKQRKELLDSFPEQTRLTPSGLLIINGPTIRVNSTITIRNRSCQPYQLSGLSTISAPGRLGFSGSPVFVQREEGFYYFGSVVSIEHPGESICTKEVMQRNAVTFSLVYGLSPVRVVQR